jgi:hypothetical protein
MVSVVLCTSVLLYIVQGRVSVIGVLVGFDKPSSIL